MTNDALLTTRTHDWPANDQISIAIVFLLEYFVLLVSLSPFHACIVS